MARCVTFFVFPGFQLLDLSGPLAVFQTASEQAGGSAYGLRVVSQRGGGVASSSGIAVATEAMQADRLDTLDTFVVVGGRGVHALPPGAITLVQAAAAKARRLASVCTGAFLLAAAGLLDGKRATTHWRFATRLQAAHPAVSVDADRIFIKDGNVWSSAGVTAGIDLALALAAEDLGAAAAKSVARDLVVYHRRPGGQSQFSAMLELDPGSARIGRALAFAREHLVETLTVERLAEAAGLSCRQFGRIFLAETGQTPAKAIERLRAEFARPMVEDGNAPLEVIARQVGFHNPERMRLGFIRVFGHPPQALRRAARGSRKSDCPLSQADQ